MWSTAFVVCVIPLYNSLAPTYNFIYKMRSTIDSPPLLWFAVPVWMTPWCRTDFICKCIAGRQSTGINLSTEGSVSDRLHMQSRNGHRITNINTKRHSLRGSDRMLLCYSVTANRCGFFFIFFRNECQYTDSSCTESPVYLSSLTFVRSFRPKAFRIKACRPIYVFSVAPQRNRKSEAMHISYTILALCRLKTQ